MVPSVPPEIPPSSEAAPTAEIRDRRRQRVILRAELHYGKPLFGYVLSVALIAIMTVLALSFVDSINFPFPFVVFYPAIIVASFVAGAGPGLAAVFLTAVVASVLFPAAPMPLNWIALAIIGPLLCSGFAHLRYIRERNRAMALELVKFKFIGDHASDWILLLNESGQIRYVNFKAANDLGWTDSELQGVALQSLVRQTQQQALHTVLEMAKAGSAKPVEFEFERRDKSMATMELGCTAVTTGEERVIYAAARDISERRLIEKRLQEIRHWESLGALSSGLAHDFNNLLTSILGNASLAKTLLPFDTEITPMLEGIMAAADRSSDLVRMLLAAAGFQTRYSEQLRVDEVLDWTLARQALPLNVRISKQIEAAAFTGDRSSLEMLLWSLISNAAEAYGGRDGEVSVQIRSGAAPGKQPASFEEGDPGKGACLGIVVADRGEGMSPETLLRAFDPFFSTRFTGRGLGLPAVRGIVRAYRGRLSLKTALGQGTRVEVWLPLTENVAN